MGARLDSKTVQRPLLGSEIFIVLVATVRKISEGAPQFFHREKLLFLSLFSVVYLLETWFRASRKLFWFDEFATIYISRLPSLKSVCNAFSHTDLNPPLLYLLTRLSERTVGFGHLGARLPEIFGFWIFCLCLFRFVSQRTNALGGFVAMLFPVVTTAYWYSYEARPHALVLAFSGLALISWQAAATKIEDRFWALAGLGFSLAGATLTHSYAFLVFLPLLIGEVTRFVLTRRTDPRMWMVMFLSASPLLLSVRLLHSVHSMSIPLSPASLGKLADSYISLFEPSVGVTTLALFVICVHQIVTGLRPIEGGTELESVVTARDGVRAYELLALVGFALVPFFTYFAARLAGTPMFERYSLSTVAGFASVLGIVSAKKPIAGILVLMLIGIHSQVQFYEFLGTRAVKEPSSSTVLNASRWRFGEGYDWMALNPHKSVPIVLLDDLEFAPEFYYAPSDLISRLIFRSPLPPFDFTWNSYAALKKYTAAPGTLLSDRDLLATYDVFLAYGTPRSLPQVQHLIKEGASVAVENTSRDHYLLLVKTQKFH